jgi:hypothetical protein
MVLERCSAQKSATLDEFYGAIAKNPVGAQTGTAMLSLIARLRGLAWPERAWGLTSHLHLVLLAEDDDSSPWFIKAVALDPRNFLVEFLLPSGAAPWPRAYVKGEASSEDEALDYLETAFRLTDGWGRRPFASPARRG